MATLLTQDVSLTGYQLRLPAFEGPLDVLLRLIERSQLAITDVSLVAVTGQFLAYVDGLGGAPPETIAEFAAVGARLVLLKSRSLLPRPPATEEDGDPGELIRQLVEYRAVKEAATHLAARDASGLGAFGRGEAVSSPRSASPPRLAAHEPGSLARLLRRRLAALPKPVAAVVARPRLSLREMTERVLAAIPANRDRTFGGVAAGCRGRHEMLTAFLAVLVLVRRRVIDAEQEILYGEIRLRRVDQAQASVELAAD